jgi:hypothetical protein
VKDNFTVRLDKEAQARLALILRHFGGTISGFSTSLAEDFSWLSIDQVAAVRSQIGVLVDTRKANAARTALQKQPGTTTRRPPG